MIRLRSRKPRRRREAGPGGFTMVEVLTVAVVVSTLVRMALPNFHEIIVKARAAEVLGDFETIRLAVENYHADNFQWPGDAYTGQVPAGLAEYLPDGYRFDQAGYRMDWENWILPNGLPKDPEAGVLLGISIVTDDRELGQAVIDFLGGAMANYTLGNKYTFVVERM